MLQVLTTQQTQITAETPPEPSINHISHTATDLSDKKEKLNLVNNGTDSSASVGHRILVLVRRRAALGRTLRPTLTETFIDARSASVGTDRKKIVSIGVDPEVSFSNDTTAISAIFKTLISEEIGRTVPSNVSLGKGLKLEDIYSDVELFSCNTYKVKIKDGVEPTIMCLIVILSYTIAASSLIDAHLLDRSVTAA